MTTRRSSYTKKAASRFYAYYDKLIEQLKNPNARPTGMFLNVKDFGDVKVSTLHNRFRDALNWLKNNNMNPNVDKRADYEYLAAVMLVKDEVSGIRVILLQGPAPQTTMRPIETIQQVADWKEEVQRFLSDLGGEQVRVFTNITMFNENLDWLKRITGALGASFHLDGDKLTVAKN